jgi:hypothetical protein
VPGVKYYLEIVINYILEYNVHMLKLYERLERELKQYNPEIGYSHAHCGCTVVIDMDNIEQFDIITDIVLNIADTTEVDNGLLMYSGSSLHYTNPLRYKSLVYYLNQENLDRLTGRTRARERDRKRGSGEVFS